MGSPITIIWSNTENYLNAEKLVVYEVGKTKAENQIFWNVK